MSSKPVEAMRSIRTEFAVVPACALAMFAWSIGASAQTKPEPYHIGVSAMLTGPISSFYAAQAEGMRIYFDALNASGGINGHPVIITFRDNRGDPAVATIDAQAFTDGGALTSSLFSASNTVPGFAQAVIRANLPTVNASWCYGPSVPGGGPKIAENYFCAGFGPLAMFKGYVEVADKLAKRLGPNPKPAYAGTDAPGNVAAFTKMLIPMLEQRGWTKGATCRQPLSAPRTIVRQHAPSSILAHKP